MASFRDWKPAKITSLKFEWKRSSSGFRELHYYNIIFATVSKKGKIPVPAAKMIWVPFESGVKPSPLPNGPVTPYKEFLF